MRKRAYIPLIIALSVVVGIVLGLFFIKDSKVGGYTNLGQANNKLNYVFNLIGREYVDKINQDSLSEMAIEALLQELDPHSVYLSAAELKKENASLNGNFDGIGVQFRLSGDSIVVVRTISGGPSERAGLLAGDRIVKVDGKQLKNINNDTVISLLRGKKGTQVKLSVYRQGINHLIDFTVRREVIKTKAVTYYGMLDSKTGYIKLDEFTANSHKEVVQALELLLDRGMQRLVFDLRDNGGGLLDQAIDIADEFATAGDLIVYTDGRLRGRNNAYATSGGLFEKGEMIVMINETSASASEIVTGCLQDNDRALIVGRRTFGKGLVQEQKQLPDGSAVRLTIARYYTPSGRCIQRPYILGDPDKYFFEDFVKRFEQGDADTISHNDSLKYKTKKGRIVYGGGGIEPDKVLSYSLLKRSSYFNSLFKNGLIYKYCFDYVDANRKQFSSYKDGDDFISRYYVSKEVYNQLIAYAQKQGAKVNGLSNKEVQEIKSLMKGYIAQNLYDDKYFYQIYTKQDTELIKACTYFKKQEN